MQKGKILHISEKLSLGSEWSKKETDYAPKDSLSHATKGTALTSTTLKANAKLAKDSENLVILEEKGATAVQPISMNITRQVLIRSYRKSGNKIFSKIFVVRR